MKKTLTILFILILFTSTARAASYSYDNLYSSDNVIAPIEIKNRGIYNLFISINILNTPYDKQIYKSTSYQNLIKRMQVEWGNAALAHVLSAKEQNINQLSLLKSNIIKDIQTLADQLKKKYGLGNDVEVVFSLTNFFLVEPRRYVHDR